MQTRPKCFKVCLTNYAHTKFLNLFHIGLVYIACQDSILIYVIPLNEEVRRGLRYI